VRFDILKWLLIVVGIGMVFVVALATVVNGFSVPNWVFPFGTLAALVGLAIP